MRAGGPFSGLPQECQPSFYPLATGRLPPEWLSRQPLEICLFSSHSVTLCPLASLPQSMALLRCPQASGLWSIFPRNHHEGRGQTASAVKQGSPSAQIIGDAPSLAQCLDMACPAHLSLPASLAFSDTLPSAPERLELCCSPSTSSSPRASSPTMTSDPTARGWTCPVTLP